MRRGDLGDRISWTLIAVAVVGIFCDAMLHVVTGQ